MSTPVSTKIKTAALSLAALALVFSGLLFYGWLATPPTANERLAVAPGVVGIPSGGAYSYVVERGGVLLLVDTGGDVEAKAILDELAARGHSADDVSAVLLTHGHRDHYAGAARFAHAAIYVGELDHFLIRGDRLPKDVWPRLESRFYTKPGIPRSVREVLPGEQLHLGTLAIDVIATPGHTEGSVMYRLGDILFCGDSMLVDGDGLRLAPWFRSWQPQTNARALLRLRGVPFRIIADGHGGIAYDGAQRYRKWLAASASP